MTTETIAAGWPATPPPPRNPGISYDGRAGPLFGLGLRVAALTLLTLGFYRFWGKTDIRRHLWSRVALGTDRFEYTGTGRELFFGFLIVLAVLIPYGIVTQTLGVLSVAWRPWAQVAVSIAQTVVVVFLLGYAVYRARRYRLSRTLLRGIRFGQTGSAARFGLMYLGYLLLSIATLGIAKPVGDVALHRYQACNTRFGNRAFDFEGRAGEMMGSWIACLLLAPFTLGLSLIWYAAFKMRYLAAGTRFGQVEFALPVRAWDLIRIYLPYFLILLLLLALLFGTVASIIAPAIYKAAAAGQPPPAFGMTVNIFIAALFFVVFGVLAPVFSLVLLTHRFIRFLTERLRIIGAADFDSIVQSAGQKSGAAEGLADALDIGAGVEIGF